MRDRLRRRTLGPLLRQRLERHRAGVALLLLLAATGCDDQVKYFSWFATMTEQPSVETYQQAPLAPPDGAVPIGASETWDLAAADTALVNPLEPSPEAVARGRVEYERFCLPCHGTTGAGDGPVMSSPQNPNRLPPLPTANLLSQRARNLSDGYVWGMIENGRGLMPAYGRVPLEERWYLVLYVRELQRLAPVQ